MGYRGLGFNLQGFLKGSFNGFLEGVRSGVPREIPVGFRVWSFRVWGRVRPTFCLPFGSSRSLVVRALGSTVDGQNPALL